MRFTDSQLATLLAYASRLGDGEPEVTGDGVAALVREVQAARALTASSKQDEGQLALIRAKLAAAMAEVERSFPAGRCRLLVATKLDEALMWAERGIREDPEYARAAVRTAGKDEQP